MRRYEWVFKWDEPNEEGVMAEELFSNHYEDYLSLKSSTEQYTHLDKLLNDYTEWESSVTNMIAGNIILGLPGLISEADLVRLSEFAEPLPFRLKSY